MGHRRKVHRLPRHRMGRAAARRPRALRVPDPRRRAGRTELVHHPRQARTYRRAFDGSMRARSRASTRRRSPRSWPMPASSATASRSQAAVKNAQAFLAVQEEFGSFDRYIWTFTGGRPSEPPDAGQLPARTPESDAMSKELRKRGFTFVGSTICYAFMQAIGMVNDHLVHLLPPPGAGMKRRPEIARWPSGVARLFRKAPKSEKRDAAFCKAIRSIPRGKVATYGQVAAAGGYPLYHRHVAALLQRSAERCPGSAWWVRRLYQAQVRSRPGTAHPAWNWRASASSASTWIWPPTSTTSAPGISNRVGLPAYHRPAKLATPPYFCV